MEVLGREKCIDTLVLNKLRSVALLSLLSMFSVSSCSQDQQCVDTEPLIVQDTVPRSLFLDSLPTLDKSILYYHIAKNKEGEIDISHAVERVLSHKEKIDDIITSFGVPLDTAMALMLTESRGVLNAKSSA